MKSILALLAIVAVANAGIVKSGGLKGSWTDVIPLTSADADVTAPGVDVTSGYQTLELYWSDYYNFDETYFLNMSAPYYDGDYQIIELQFSVTGELEWPNSYAFYYKGQVDCIFWSGADMATPDATLVPNSACYLDSDNDVSCDFYIGQHYKPGDYSLYCTLADQNGNTAVITPASFDEADQPMFTLAHNFPDVTAPVISGFALSGGDITLDASETDVATAGNKASVTVTVDDGEWEESDNYDPYSSGLSDYTTSLVAWVTVQDVDENSWDFPLIYQTYDDETGAQEFALGFFFSNMFNEGVYTITSVSARDQAGNIATQTISASNVITISYDDASESEAFSCQTLEVFGNDAISDPEPVVTAEDEDYVYVSTTCELKDNSGYSYVGIRYQSDAYEAAGWSEEAMYNVWTSYFDGGAGPWADDGLAMGIAWNTGDDDYDYVTLGDIGNYYTGETTQIYSDLIYFPPAAPEADYWLVEVYTVAPGGAVQLYNLAEGAASSVVPSIFAVAVAAAVALLRL